MPVVLHKSERILAKNECLLFWGKKAEKKRRNSDNSVKIALQDKHINSHSVAYICVMIWYFCAR